jgi:micrococcal nuclease
VTKVVDGDTIRVDNNGKCQKIRMIGMDTPETVDPRKPVQCFGLEASAQVLSIESLRGYGGPRQSR